MNRYNKISPDVRKELESKLAARFAKTSKTGMAKRLLKGEDVENHLTKTFKEHSDKTTKDIDKKTQDAIVSINQRIDAVLKYMQSVVQAKVDGIRVPEDGRTPSADEIKALLSPMVDETRTQFTQRISKIEDLLTKAPKESDVPTDLKGLEAFVKSKIPKLGGGGGGASYLFELFDTPAKSKSRQGAYVGYEGLVLAVSDDGKGLVFQESGSSLPNQTGNAGKFLKSTGTEGEEEWDTIAGGGDMLAATYDPAAGAKQVAFNDELHAPVTVTDTTEVDLTLTGQAVSAVLKAGSIAKARLVTAVQTSLGLADTATQPGDLATVATSGDYDDLSNKPDLSALATKANVLELDNTTSFTPDADYEPATKKYVDDNAGGGPDVQTFTSSGTWTKPVGATFALVEIYAGGGSGGASVEDYSASTGGAGGQYISALIVGSSLTSTVSVTVGDGGALVTAVEYPATIDGIDGGDSSFGTYVVGIGGQGGNAVGGSSEITAPGATAGAGTDFDGLLYANESGENSSSAPATAASSRVASSDGGEAGPADNKSLGGAGVSSNSSATATAGETPGAGGGGVATRGGPAISGAGGGGKVVITSF